MDTAKIRVIFEYEFRRGTNAAETARNINAAFGEGSTNERTVRFWFKRFRDGNFDLKNEPRGRPPTQVNNDELKEIVEADPSQTTQELAAWFNVTLPTILTHLRQINKIKKYEKWVPHDLTDLQKETRVETCVALLNRYRNEGILDRIVTCDEKWILYDNRKRKMQWLTPGQMPQQCPKAKLTNKKVMVTVWWSQHGVIHYSFLRSGQAITADVYCAELRTMLTKLAVKQPRLMNRSSPLLLHDNARPHTARETILTLQELQLETIRHPPYSPDLAPTDYHFFRDLDNYLRDKKFSSQEAVQNAFTQFVQSRSSEFYRKGINDLPIRWQQCIDNNGNYFD